jgi:hypothetical protein
MEDGTWSKSRFKGSPMRNTDLSTDLSSAACFSIGGLARLAECGVDTIRYYERIGLMPRAERSDGGQRRYREAQARQLLFIRRLRNLGSAWRRSKDSSA